MGCPYFSIRGYGALSLSCVVRPDFKTSSCFYEELTCFEQSCIVKSLKVQFSHKWCRSKALDFQIMIFRFVTLFSLTGGGQCLGQMCCLHPLHLYTEGGGSRFLLNINCLLDYLMSHSFLVSLGQSHSHVNVGNIRHYGLGLAKLCSWFCISELDAICLAT